jgi:hypothetical protein
MHQFRNMRSLAAMRRVPLGGSDIEAEGFEGLPMLEKLRDSVRG